MDAAKDNADHGTPLFSPQEVFLEGPHHDLVFARELSPRGERVLLKTLRHPEPLSADVLQERRALVAAEHAHLEALADIALFPSPLGLLRWPTERDGEEPVVAYAFLEGETLSRSIARQGTPELATWLPAARSLIERIGQAHERRYVLRALQPDHVILAAGGARLVGAGVLTLRQTRPVLSRLGTDPLWSAPEIESETSGAFLTPRADVYSIGLLLAYWATGERPTGDANAPLRASTWEALGAAHEGLRLLVAHCLQPFHKNRLANAGRVATFLDMESLPSARTPGFAEVALAAPWLDPSRHLSDRVGNLSPGPLVSRPPAQPPDAGAQAATPAAPTAPQGASTQGQRPFWVFSLLVALLALASLAWRMCSAMS